MNRHDGPQDLHDPSDKEITILHEICKSASTSTTPPWAALFDSYEEVFKAHNLDTRRDPNVFRWLMRIANLVRPGQRHGIPSDFIQPLKSLMNERGIEIVEEEPNVDGEGVTEPLEANIARPASSEVPRMRRRVSFDDARLEETWLSEHSKSLHQAPQALQPDPSNQARLRGRNFESAQLPRARSISNRDNRRTSLHVTQHRGQAAIHAPQSSNLESSLFFRPSQAELEENADAFLATSDFRIARRCLHIWHDQTLLAEQWRVKATDIALARDRRVLLKQSLDILLEKFGEQKAMREHQSHLKTTLEGCVRKKDRWLLAKAFSHWDESARHQKRATAVAQRYTMKVKYFNRWRRIAVDNAAKLRSLQTHKWLNRWRNMAAQREVDQEQAIAFQEESLLRAGFRHLYWTFYGRQVEGWYERQIRKRSLNNWHTRLGSVNQQRLQATSVWNRDTTKRAIWKLASSFRSRQQHVVLAKQHHDRKLMLGCLQSMSHAAELHSLAKAVSEKVRHGLMRKTLEVWHLQLVMSREATFFNQKHALLSSWRSWKSALGYRMVEQRVNDRILVETIYRWAIQQRLRTFQKNRNLRTLQRTLDTWVSRRNAQCSVLDHLYNTYKQQERQRRLRSGMLSLYSAFRSRENASRAATEFATARSLPKTMEMLVQQYQNYQQLAHWARDARFYCLTTHTLKTWHSKTSEHKHNRRRLAYAQIRSRVKYRIVRDCFAQWHRVTKDLVPLQEEADRRQEARLIKTAVQGFDVWHEKAAFYTRIEKQADAIDRRKLKSSVLLTMSNQHADLASMEDNAYAFRQESDIALLSVTLKRVQWAAFTASRRVETADALWVRNRDQHVRRMLRHAISQALSRRAAKASSSQQEPESPSLRPASRLAARSEGQAAFDESNSTPITPAYMRTPSRSRRSGSRFRALPTPAMVTPMAFNSTLLATTQAFPSSAMPADESEEQDDTFVSSTPRVTPFAHRLKAGGVTPAVPPSALRSSVFGAVGNGRNAGGTNKSVRFVQPSRFSGGRFDQAGAG